MRTADAVIIGGGVIGVSIAFHLMARGLRRVILLERQFLGAGGTGRSVGIIRQLYPTPETTAMVLASLAVFKDFGEAVGGHSGYVGCGALIGVAPAMRPALEKTLALQRSLGVKAELLAPEEVARVEPRIDAATLGGASIEQGVEVAGVRHVAGRVTGVVTASGEEVAAPVVVNAAGLWSPRVARLAGVELPIIVGRHPVFVLERPANFGAPHMVYLDLSGGAYIRPETGGLTLTGSLTDDEAQHPMDPELLGGETGLDEATDTLARTARAVPALTDARFTRGYAGAFDITPDWMPILDQSPLAGFFIAAGMSGHGFKLAPSVGALMAALITEAIPPVNPAPFRLDRFTAGGPAGTFVSSYLR